MLISICGSICPPSGQLTKQAIILLAGKSFYQLVGYYVIQLVFFFSLIMMSFFYSLIMMSVDKSFC